MDFLTAEGLHKPFLPTLYAAFPENPSILHFFFLYAGSVDVIPSFILHLSFTYPSAFRAKSVTAVIC
jgi:hypothetical protein